MEPLGPHAYVDLDSDDSFLSIPEPRYVGRTPEQDSAAVDAVPKDEIPPLPAPGR